VVASQQSGFGVCAHPTLVFFDSLHRVVNEEVGLPGGHTMRVTGIRMAMHYDSYSGGHGRMSRVARLSKVLAIEKIGEVAPFHVVPVTTRDPGYIARSKEGGFDFNAAEHRSIIKAINSGDMTFANRLRFRAMQCYAFKCDRCGMEILVAIPSSGFFLRSEYWGEDHHELKLPPNRVRRHYMMECQRRPCVVRLDDVRDHKRYETGRGRVEGKSYDRCGFTSAIVSSGAP